MSYCRAGFGSDVYMYASICGGFQFHIGGDSKYEPRDFNVASIQEAIDKFKELEAAGVRFPKSAVERLEREKRELEIELRQGE